MDFKEIISQHRNLYIDDFLQYIQGENKGANEVLIAMDNEESIEQFKLYRIDHFQTVDGLPHMMDFNSERYLDYEPFGFTLGEMNIDLSPFHWNGCEFIVSPKPANHEWLVVWINKWIDKEDIKPKDESGLQSVIHSVTRPIELEDAIHFSVDFGSADLEAFSDLINAIYSQGSKSLK